MADFEAAGGHVVAERNGDLSLFVTIYGNPRDRQLRAMGMARGLGQRHRLRRKITRWARKHRPRS
ncbi:hypothetical protein EIK56_23025 [Sphingomonas sp. C8-2]|nr:hypothetical protein EIK56_23025 [Sphingomonas sp. C8-2]